MSGEAVRVLPGKWIVRAGGAVIAESRDVVEIAGGEAEGGFYFPRADIAMAFLEPESAGASPQRFGVVTKSRTINAAAWSYLRLEGALEALSGRVGFADGEHLKVQEV